MTIVTSYDWESDTWTHNSDNPARTAWREAVAEIADKARAKLPECNGRVDSAVKIVLAGDVELIADGTAKVASQSNGTTHYVVCNGTCECKDFAKAPHQLCKHRLSAAIARRAQELTKAKLAGTNGHVDAPAQSAAPVETPQSVPAQYITYLHGKPFVRYAGLLALAHERGLVSLKAHLISVTAELALAEADATFADGKTYSECADSTPQNVPQHIRPHFPRMALTSAKARTLRDALNIGIAALEELDGE
jgi:hypothetical protein